MLKPGCLASSALLPFKPSSPTFAVIQLFFINQALLDQSSSFKSIISSVEMYSASPRYQLPSPLLDPPVVLFRAVPQSSRYGGSLGEKLDLVARGPDKEITWQAFHDCLSWRPVNTPFIPFTRSWCKVLRRRQLLLEKGQNDVIIIAIWSKGLRNVYDAHKVAQKLGFQSRSSNPRRRLENHLDEYLVHGGIYAYEYRMLAFFHGCTLVDVPLSLPGHMGRAKIPHGFLADGVGRTVEEKLENEIYQHTGIRGQHSEQLLCLIGSLNGAIDRLWM